MALVISSESFWSFAIDPIDPQKNNYLETFRDELHVPLVNAHYHRDIIDPDADYAPINCWSCNVCPCSILQRNNVEGLGR